MNRGRYLYLIASILILAGVGAAHASSNVPQTVLPGECIPQFAAPMPVFGPAGTVPRVDAFRYPSLTVKMKEGSQQVLPAGTYQVPAGTCPPVTLQPTRIWGYETSDTISGRLLGPLHWPGVTVDARRNVPAMMQYVNLLPSFDNTNPTGPGLVQGLLTNDQSIHWADPLMMMGMGMNNSYVGPVPAVPHLHGGEVPPQFDGGPFAWFTPDGRRGPTYASLWPVGPGKALYRYNNTQEPGTTWFHDHALGATRTNVYSGLAAFYLLRDPRNEPVNLPKGAFEIEMAIQDRQFDTNSQLFFPDGTGDPLSNLNGTPPNPLVHPFWIPEYFGDVAVVNGAPWPFLDVEAKRYRFRLLNGSNARFYNLAFGGLPVYAIGADDAYLDAPAPIATALLIAPGERVDIIVDFAGRAGQTITVTNDAPAPFPNGPLVPGIVQPTMANILQFRVKAAASLDNSCNPAAGQCTRPVPMVRLATGTGAVAPGVTWTKRRQLILKENATLGGPLEVLLNNTRWNGMESPSVAAQFAADNGVSEMPQVGTTELWEIINLTMDAHPIHTHLAQFQVVNRESFSQDPVLGYPAAWEASFGLGSAPLLPGCTPGVFCPAYGPPLDYLVPNADGAIGGNPAVSPYLLGNVAPPSPEESGWKDTSRVLPGEVMRILVRWAPTSAPVAAAVPGSNLYPFDPTGGVGYVWHCHILDHEDNEMMRPYKVVK